MKSWIIIITFVISITSLLFKTTEDTPSGLKKLNKWGFVLLGFMISALVINFLITEADKKETKLKIENQKIQDSLIFLKNENRWKISMSNNTAIVDKLQSDLKLSNEIKQQQDDNINIQKKFNQFLFNKIASSQSDLNSIRFPIDTLYLSFKATLKCNTQNKVDYFEQLFENGSWYPIDDFNRYQFLFQKNKTEFEKFSDMEFSISIETENGAPTFDFEYENVPKLLDNKFNHRKYNSDEKTAFSTIYYWPDRKEYEIYANRIQCVEIQKNGALNLKNICQSKCIVSLTRFGLYKDFDLSLNEIILSNTNNDKKVYFDNFKYKITSNPYYFGDFVSDVPIPYRCTFQ